MSTLPPRAVDLTFDVHRITSLPPAELDKLLEADPLLTIDGIRIYGVNAPKSGEPARLVGKGRDGRWYILVPREQ